LVESRLLVEEGFIDQKSLDLLMAKQKASESETPEAAAKSMQKRIEPLVKK
jgi:hypothetical protein